MDFEVFVDRINEIVKRSDCSVTVEFFTDFDIGKHYAKCSDGTMISCRLSGCKVTVQWGCRHTALADM